MRGSARLDQSQALVAAIIAASSSSSTGRDGWGSRKAEDPRVLGPRDGPSKREWLAMAAG